ncbi:ABC transporter ATP-binding protein [Bordetella petrii]|uniref:ABC transporter ATP-binding protein n=1 Tax=Bordetella petrii TaxID=94624 RepID=UPI0006845105|nr:ABC transporter ATP-binding protein [Bordetella petrii]
MFELHNVTKSYLTPRGRRYVFRDLTLAIPPERNIGLIGRNGAGKSTLMRLLGGVDQPDSGKILTDKSISWPVGLGGGFQGSMSGRDNVKFVCRVYGAIGPEMSEKIRYVQEFADIGRWFDEPTKSYSSGMRSRLAFGLSMAFDFDYYLIDEVMSVGDAHFKKKSAEVFAEKMKKSNIILVSHTMPDIRRLCNLVLLVENGTVRIYDDVAEGIKAYQA